MQPTVLQPRREVKTLLLILASGMQGSRRETLSPMDSMVSRLGVEPRTLALKGLADPPNDAESIEIDSSATSE